MSDSDKFAEITEEIGERIIVSITQRPDEMVVDYEVDGTDDLDIAIAATVKAIVTMCLDAIGLFDRYDDDEPDDEG